MTTGMWVAPQRISEVALAPPVFCLGLIQRSWALVMVAWFGVAAHVVTRQAEAVDPTVPASGT